MATFYQTDCEEKYEYHRFSHLVENHCQIALGKFKQILNSYALFHISFLSIILLQFSTAVCLCIMMPKSPWFAISLASLFLMIFSYVIINYYLQGKKPDQFEQIKRTFFQECQKAISLDVNDEDYHFSIAHSAFQLTTYLSQKQVYAISIPPFNFFKETTLKISFTLHAKDILMMQEMLMQRSIEEHIELIKQNPTDLSVHTSLANAYIALSKIYTQRPEQVFDDSALIQRFFDKASLKEKSAYATKKAIEELKILDDLAPNDPWIHAQLANCYHHLNMHDDEIREYEILLNLRATDKEILYRLGLLYFRLGKNAKGLKIYKKLHQLDALEAQHLLSHYL